MDNIVSKTTLQKALFFKTWGKITIKNQSHVDEIKNFLDAFTFKNHDTNHDTKSNHEYLCFYTFLIETLKTGKTILPVIIEKAESPDFRFYRVDKKPYLGLEHTRATIPKYEMDNTELNSNKYPQNSLMELSFYKPKNTLSEKSNIAIKMPGQKLTGDGWVDDQQEKEWAETIIEAITLKTKLLNKEHTLKFSQNELIVEYVGPLMPNFLEIDKAIRILKQNYIPNNFNKIYDKIHIFSVPNFAYDVFGKTITCSES